ncbi:MAG: hypothetical protein E7411_04785 [Ruminococcaceae bacterium]|nr:hypothetical protein [Oscillospiraceae bacterium]
MHLAIHSLIHSFQDNIKILPFIFLMYIIIEYIEHKNNTDLSHFLMKAKGPAPLYGSILGAVPQCGFSVIASDLYAKRALSLGTLIAIFISTSDEAVPILLANPHKAHLVINVILIKIIIGTLFGLLIDLFYKRKTVHGCNNEHEHHHFHGNCESCDKGFFKSAVIHTVKIFIFIFIAGFILTYFTELIGEEKLSHFLLKNSFLQPFIASLIGLIPNCAPSVILTESYISGMLDFGSLIAGLSSSAGVGLMILCKENKNFKENLIIILLLFLIGGISGCVLKTFTFFSLY